MIDHWLVLGASSSIARAFIREVAAKGAYVTVAGRDLTDLHAIAADAKLRGAKDARVLECDVANSGSRATCAASAAISGATFNVLLAIGTMPDQAAMQADTKVLDGMLESTLTGPMILMELLAPKFLEQKSGHIILIGSVAGDRGRLKNYLYGAAKAGLAIYAEGLRARFFHAKTQVSVTLVKPGFVDTSMTWGLPGLFLVASPQECARAMLRAGEKNTATLYFPRFWELIMLAIKHIPAAIMKRLSF